MDQHPNLTSYDTVESLDNFSEKSFKLYCEGKLKSTSKTVSLIYKNCVDSSWLGKVCEIGSGNSKLLYSLEKEELLNEGVGIEISNSRHKFAEKFKTYVNSLKVKNLNINVFDALPLSNFDIIIAVDIVLQLITPLHKSAEQEIFKLIRKSLKPKGYILLELWGFEEIKNLIDMSNNDLRIWEKYSQSDPFEFVLAHISQNKDNDLLWKKLFLKRGSQERSEILNILRPYSPPEITSILKANGFGEVNIFENWNKCEGRGQGKYMVLAQKG